MKSFVYNAQPARVIFGSGTIAKLPEEIDRLGLKRVLVLATPPREADARRHAELLGHRAAGVFARAAMHT
ncbi:MAG: maleylacetate reductase, partial [Mesorhizobium sp.]